MKSTLLAGIAIASALAIQPVPASSQGVYGAAHPHVGHAYAGRGPARSQYQHPGYGHGQSRGYGVGAGVAAVGAGALIGGALATQNQGYYTDQTYPVYSDPGYQYSDAAPVVSDNGDSVAYCEQTYRSYDPSSGTYLGYDGFRHPCP
jgi:hypothetical protein